MSNAENAELKADFSSAHLPEKLVDAIELLTELSTEGVSNAWIDRRDIHCIEEQLRGLTFCSAALVQIRGICAQSAQDSIEEMRRETCLKERRMAELGLAA